MPTVEAMKQERFIVSREILNH